MKVRHTVESSDQLYPRVMAASRQRVVASVDRGVHRLGIGGKHRHTHCFDKKVGNFAGYNMYKDISAGKFKSICDYVSGQMDEKKNPSDYSPAMKDLVDRNLGN